MRLLVLSAALLSCVGCYAYYPSPAGVPRPGVRVAAELSDSGTMSLARLVGPSVAAVEGQLIRSSDTEIELSVSTVRQHGGAEASWRGERITVSRDLLRGIQERRFSTGRTTLFTAGLIVGGIALRQAFQGKSGGPTPIEGGGGQVPR